eukprot:Awhi_evm1s17
MLSCKQESTPSTCKRNCKKKTKLKLLVIHMLIKVAEVVGGVHSCYKTTSDVRNSIAIGLL